MKKLLIIALCVFSVLITMAQSRGSAKLYGFREAVISGVNKSHVEEGGEQVNIAGKPGVKYMIYLQSAVRVYPSEIWIDGEPYGVSLQTVPTPVERQEFTAPSQKKTVLVPSTTDKVVKLTPVPPVESKLTAKGRELAAANELIVVYKQGGKFYYSTLKELKQLEPVALQ